MSIPRLQDIRPACLVIPLQSSRPTGMGIAARSAESLLAELQPEYRPPEINLRFQRLNDSRWPGPARMLWRLVLAQKVPGPNSGADSFPLNRDKAPYPVYASHHAPLRGTDGHALIIHDLISLHHPAQHLSQTIFFRLLLTRVLKAADRIITISETVAGELRSRFPFLTENQHMARLTVIPSYSEKLDRYQPSELPLSERLARREFLVIGAHFRHKNLDIVLDAIRQLRGEGHDIRLQIVGVDPRIWRFCGLEKDLREDESWLTCHPYASEEHLETLLGRVTALLYPSSSEGMGLPPLEAMARGCPVICSNISVLRETCGSAAIYVPPRDSGALATVLLDLIRGRLRDDCQRQVEAGFARIKLFQRAALLARWSAWLASLPHNQPSRRGTASWEHEYRHTIT